MLVTTNLVPGAIIDYADNTVPSLSIAIYM